ncbi:aromatic acid exporter family protein [Alkalibacterium sp.]
MSIRERTIKMVLATLLSIFAAQVFQLEHALAAGIIAILSLLDTKRASFITAVKRTASTVAAFLIATIVFYIMGFTVWAFGVYLAVYVPVAYKFDLQIGIAPASVLVTHFMGANSIALVWQINGMGLMLLGAAGALIINLWMPSYLSELEESKEQIDDKLRYILKVISFKLAGENPSDRLKELLYDLENQLVDSKQKALNEYDNQLFNKEDYIVRYLEMRQIQINILKRMLYSLQNITLETSQAHTLAELYKETAEQLNEKNTGLALLEKISLLYREFRKSDLPKNRDEFENRAVLFQLLHEIEAFIEIKRQFFVEGE